MAEEGAGERAPGPGDGEEVVMASALRQGVGEGFQAAFSTLLGRVQVYPVKVVAFRSREGKKGGGLGNKENGW
jgi:hypothetical protein